MPGAPVSLIIAATATALSVIRLTCAPSGAVAVTFPIRPSPSITGSLTCTPAELPLSMLTVEYHRLAGCAITSAVTGR